jgi:hypothetical protein
MHVGHKPPLQLAQVPLQSARKRTDSKESQDAMYDPLRLAEDLGEGGKRGRPMRQAPQRNFARRAGNATFQEAVDQPASAQKAALELSNLLVAVNPPIASHGSADPTSKPSASAREPSLDELLSKCF